MKRLAMVAVVCLALSAAGCSRDNLPERTTGAGSTFVNPLMIRWTAEYKRAKEDDVTYHSLGSTAGIQWMTDKKADFGCTDAPMTNEQVMKANKLGGEVVHIPLVHGAVVPVYNVDGLKKPLHFTGAVLADIYLGKIKKWNEPPLAELNPDAGLPDKEIVVVHRADGSGTTFIWTDYLSKVSTEWKRRVGAVQGAEWPIGVKQTGNEGVAQHVKDTPGSIGYVELAYVHKLDLQFGLVQNFEKEFVKATIDSITAAAAEADPNIPADLRFSLTNCLGKKAYPICGTTWAVLYLHQPAAREQKVVDFLYWVIHDGQEFTRDLLYAPLPASLVERADKKLNLVTAGK
jgi:phosphate transport system substrate-binding protein